jgi:hypothetical protein
MPAKLSQPRTQNHQALHHIYLHMNSIQSLEQLAQFREDQSDGDCLSRVNLLHYSNESVRRKHFLIGHLLLVQPRLLQADLLDAFLPQRSFAHLVTMAQARNCAQLQCQLLFKREYLHPRRSVHQNMMDQARSFAQL